MDLGWCAPHLGGDEGRFAIDAGHLYFTGTVSVEPDTCRGLEGVHRVPLDGGAIETIVSRRAMHSRGGIAVGGGYVFFTTFEGLFKVPL